MILSDAGRLAIPLGDCATQTPADAKWEFGGATGRVLCRVSEGDALIEWSFDGTAVLAVAVRHDGDSKAGGETTAAPSARRKTSGSRPPPSSRGRRPVDSGAWQPSADSASVDRDSADPVALHGLVRGPREVDPVIRTDEWVAWARGPDGQRVDGQAGSPEAALTDFTNKMRNSGQAFSVEWPSGAG